MSTRATIILTYQAGNTIQMYHHHDGYPEYMGKLLENFCNTAFFMRYGTGVDNAMYNLLKMEKGFEIEERGLRHTDVEYVWYVKLTKEGYEISYTEVNPKYDKISEIEDNEEFSEKVCQLFDSLLSSDKGEELYA